MKIAAHRTAADVFRRFEEDCGKAFQFLEPLGFRRKPDEADTRIHTLRYAKRGVWLRVTYDLLDQDVVAHLVRRRRLRRHVIRFGWIHVGDEDEFAEALSTLAAGVKSELEGAE